LDKRVRPFVTSLIVGAVLTGVFYVLAAFSQTADQSALFAYLRVPVFSIYFLLGGNIHAFSETLALFSTFLVFWFVTFVLVEVIFGVRRFSEAPK